MEVGCWLRSLGPAQYAATFRENAINEALLPKLTAEDLKDIDVRAVGHRRVLIDATPPKRMRLTRRPNRRTSPTASAAGSPKSSAANSTALSARVAPEDLRGITAAIIAAARN